MMNFITIIITKMEDKTKNRKVNWGSFLLIVFLSVNLVILETLDIVLLLKLYQLKILIILCKIYQLLKDNTAPVIKKIIEI